MRRIRTLNHGILTFIYFAHGFFSSWKHVGMVGLHLDLAFGLTIRSLSQCIHFTEHSERKHSKNILELRWQHFFLEMIKIDLLSLCGSSWRKNVGARLQHLALYLMNASLHPAIIPVHETPSCYLFYFPSPRFE